MNNFYWTLSWILMIGGGLLVLAGRLSRAYNEEKQRYKGKTTGTVTAVVADSPDERGMATGVHDYYYPVIAYYANGRFYKERSLRGGNPCPYVVGQKLELQYNVKDPSHFIIARKTKWSVRARMMYYAGLISFLTGGVIFILFAMRVFAKNS